MRNRKLFRAVLALALLLCLTAVSSAVYANQPSVMFDGEVLDFELPIINRGGRTFYPMRELLDALGAEVGWNDATQDGNRHTGQKHRGLSD